MRIPSRALVLIACLISLLADPVHSQWQQIKLPRSAAGRSEIVSANGMLFVRGMFRSLDNGDSWEKCGSQEIGPFFIQGGEIFGCTPDLKIWKSSNWGQSWSLLINTPIPKSVISISRTSAGVFLALTGHEVYRYNAVQQNWQNTTAFPTLLTPKAWWIRGNDVWICCLQGL